MGPSRFTLPNLEAIVPDVAAFALGLASARLLGWNTTDLVWSLWLGSLVIGYLSILAVIGKGASIGSAIVASDGFPAQYRSRAILIGSAVALFVLAFFSLHFCAFHAVHASFLSSFFPLDGAPKGAFIRGLFNPVGLWNDALHYVAPKYGVFLIPVAIAERRALLGSIGALINAARLKPEQGIVRLLKSSGASAHGLFSRPYVNVFRMHLLIIFFGICHVLKIDSFPVYVVVYSVYFFPWSAFKKTADQPQAA